MVSWWKEPADNYKAEAVAGISAQDDECQLRSGGTD